MYWNLFLTLFLSSLLSQVSCKGCQTLDGFWYNQLGSEIFLAHSKDGKLIGEYRTAVERAEGAAGKYHSIILGAAPYDNAGAAFAFAVVWRNGSSTTVWTAQCLTCDDGNEKLLTSWLLRSKVDTCVDKWKSTMIGRDTFTRYEQHPGPRKPDHTPPSLPETNTDFGSLTFIQRKPCGLVGNWYNDVGSEMILKQDFRGIIVGEYRTAVEREKGAAGTTHSKVFGIGTNGNPNSTFAYFVVWQGGASVTGWVGQCHVCGENQTQTIESTWLLKSKISKCGDNWKSTLYGENSFTQEDQTAGPRKSKGTHTPGRDGEDVGSCSSGVLLTSGFMGWIVVLVSQVLYV